MPKITPHQFQFVYESAKVAYSRGDLIGSIYKQLAEDVAMNPVSAFHYIEAYTSMRQGVVFKRTINLAATRFFFDGIARDEGHQELAKAIISLEAHIAYYEKTSGVRCKGLRDIVVEYGSRPAPKIVGPVDEELLRLVDEAVSLPADQRKLLLPVEGSKPRIVETMGYVFVRNQHVIAEVLFRASGICEHCKRKAPFLSKRTGQPFLEVHHKETLADGGDDTVENAIALCPNCHRFKHFGVPGSLEI